MIHRTVEWKVCMFVCLFVCVHDLVLCLWWFMLKWTETRDLQQEVFFMIFLTRVHHLCPSPFIFISQFLHCLFITFPADKSRQSSSYHCCPKHKNQWTLWSNNKMNFPTAQIVPRMRYLCWLYYYQHRMFDLTDSLLCYSMSCSAMLAHVGATLGYIQTCPH